VNSITDMRIILGRRKIIFGRQEIIFGRREIIPRRPKLPSALLQTSFGAVRLGPERVTPGWTMGSI